MDFEIFDKTIKLLNNPLIDIKLIENKHLIFVKYTSELYYKYSIELIENLCKKSKSENKKLLFYTALNFLLKILYNSGNTPCLKNLDLIILCSFSLGIKSIESRNRSPSINGLKLIYPEKYILYQNSDIKLGEIICLKLLNYNINILTSYECLFYLLNKKNKLNLLDQYIQHLDNTVISGDKKFIFKCPIDIAKETIEFIKKKEKQKININVLDIIKVKEVPFSKNNEKSNFIMKKIILNNESISTNCSSAVNISNLINNSIYSSSKNKSQINNKFQNIFYSSERIIYSNYGKNPIEKKLKINLIYEDSDKNKDNFILNPKKNKITENTNKIKYINTMMKSNINSNYFYIKKDDENVSPPNKYKKYIKVNKKNLKENFEARISYDKTKILLLEKDKKPKNYKTNNANSYRIFNNNMNFKHEKLNELCKKINFDVFGDNK